MVLLRSESGLRSGDRRQWLVVLSRPLRFRRAACASSRPRSPTGRGVSSCNGSGKQRASHVHRCCFWFSG
eukprot:10231370-Alexandrium_andersonii.AAC.1